MQASTSCVDASKGVLAADPATSLQLEIEGKVLALVEQRRADGFRRRMPNATVVTDVDSLEGLQGRFDAAIIDGLLEAEPWDRWMLQRVHKLLRMGAPIVVVVPPLRDLASATDLRFLAYASRKLLQRLLKPWRPGLEPPGAVRRRYQVSQLIRKMEVVGYTAITARRRWPGGAREARAAWLSRRLTLIARKGPSLAGLQGRAWPDPQAHRERYAEKFAAMSAARDQWVGTFPEFRRMKSQALEPAEWRDASVLVLSPHPDDELIGCGGTLCRLLSEGAKVSILQATDGCRLESLGDLPEARRKIIRLEEAARVASALGARLFSWRHEDARLRCSTGTIGQLAALLRELRPTHVLTPFLADMHADHGTLSRILAGALADALVQPQILQYEVWSLVPANLYCDVTERMQMLERLLFLYERAMRVEDFVHFCESRNLARAFELMRRPGYVEAFLSTTSAEYRRLADRSAR